MDYSDNYYVRTKAFSLNTNKLNESLQCDVCIIGAGLSGISSALYLSKLNPDLNIVILEKNKVGWGASGRNGGQLLHGFPQRITLAKNTLKRKLRYYGNSH